MLWSDESETQPKHHSGKPQSQPQNGCIKGALFGALIIVAVLLIRAAAG